MFERFTEQSRRVVVLAQEEARMLGHNHIGSEHLLLGLLHEQGTIAADVLASAGITVEAARSQVEELAGPGDKLRPSGHIPFTQRAKKILELSLREALEQRKTYIGTEHILLALMRDADGTGARVLERLGGSLPALRQQVLEASEEAAAGPATTTVIPAEEMWTADWRHAQGFAREPRFPPPGHPGPPGAHADRPAPGQHRAPPRPRRRRGNRAGIPRSGHVGQPAPGCHRAPPRHRRGPGGRRRRTRKRGRVGVVSHRKINCLTGAVQHRLNCFCPVPEGFCHVLARARPPVSSARHP